MDAHCSAAVISASCDVMPSIDWPLQTVSRIGVQTQGGLDDRSMKRATSAVIRARDRSSNHMSTSTTWRRRCKSLCVRRLTSGALHAINASRADASSATASMSLRFIGSAKRARCLKAERRSAARICACASSASAALASSSSFMPDLGCTGEAVVARSASRGDALRPPGL